MGSHQLRWSSFVPRTITCTSTRRNRCQSCTRTRAARSTWCRRGSRVRCRARLSGRSGRKPLNSCTITRMPPWRTGSGRSSRVTIRCPRYRTSSCTSRSLIDFDRVLRTTVNIYETAHRTATGDRSQ
ncbi:hypothetical protein ACFX2I_043777 [Malus domestica]